MRYGRTLCGWAVAFGFVSTCATTAAAHVAFDYPASGQVLYVGETVELRWTDTIPHDTESYDLELLVGPERTVQPIALAVDASVHSYDWLVPDLLCDDCALRVLQRNINYTDYDHTIPIVIASPDASSQSAAGAAGTETAGEESADMAAQAADDGADVEEAADDSSGCTVVRTPVGGRSSTVVVLGLFGIFVLMRRRSRLR